jgi:hypothetical protein
MISKHLEKKIRLDRDSYQDDINIRTMDIEYYLVESEIEEIEELSGQKTYGFEIVKVINDINTESKLIKDYSYSEIITRDVLSKLVNNAVMPIELSFILDDLIGV